MLSKELLLKLVDDCMSHDLTSFRSAVLQAQAPALQIGTDPCQCFHLAPELPHTANDLIIGKGRQQAQAAG